jgi:hypothetical protein
MRKASPNRQLEIETPIDDEYRNGLSDHREPTRTHKSIKPQTARAGTSLNGNLVAHYPNLRSRADKLNRA